MPSIRQILVWKIVLSTIVALLLVFVPFTDLPWLQVPEYDPASAIFIRLLGLAYLALAIVQAWGCVDSSSGRAAVIAALAETLGVALLVWHFIFYGYLATWPIVGKAIVSVVGVVASLFALLIALTGYRLLLGAPPSDGASGGTPLPPSPV